MNAQRGTEAVADVRTGVVPAGGLGPVNPVTLDMDRDAWLTEDSMGSPLCAQQGALWEVPQ